MKPIIIYLDKNDEIKLTKKEFEQYIKDAYNQGYDCGYTEGKKNYWNPWWYNNNPVLTTNTTGNITINPPSTPETCVSTPVNGSTVNTVNVPLTTVIRYVTPSELQSNPPRN